MESFWQDLRYSLRMLRRNPGFTVVAVVVLALGIGANTAIFSVVHSVLLRPLPYADPDGLVFVGTTSKPFGPGAWPMSQPNFADFAEQNTTLDMVITRGVTLNMAGPDQTERITGARVSTNFLRLLGLSPYAGRDFVAEEEKPGAPAVMMISHGLWQRSFGAAPDLIGKTLNLDGQSYEVIGIMPQGLSFPTADTEFLIPFIPTAGERARALYFLRPIARLKSGVTLAQADAEMKAIAARLEQQYPDNNTGMSVELLPLHQYIAGDTRTVLWVLFATVGCVLLIACANIANLLLARAVGRSAEMAIRSALGAARGRLLRQLVTESLLLSLLGSALGLTLAAVGVPLLTGISASSIPRAGEIQLDATVLLFTFALAVLAGLAFGLAPGLQLSRWLYGGALQGGVSKGGSQGRGYRRALNVLVVGQVAVALVLLTGAGLMLRSFLVLRQVDPGFAPGGLLTFEMGAARSRYPGNQEQAEFYRKAVEAVAAVPGVDSAAAVHRLPLYGNRATTGFQIEGRPLPPGTPGPTAENRIVTPGFFSTMKIPLLAGRDFTERDVAGATDVVVISQLLAEQHWPGESPLGKRIQVGGLQDRWWEIAGVVGDVKMRALERDTGTAIYWTLHQNGFPGALRSVFLLVRSRNDAAAISNSVRAAIRQVDAEEGLARLRTMDDVVAESVAGRELSLVLMLVFAALAATLAAVGIYGVMSYAVTQRTHEIGIRMALGAQPADVLFMVLRRGLLLTLLGVTAGLAGSMALTQFLKSLLYGVSVTDPLTFAAVALLLCGVSLAACYLPARRATRVEPVRALRYQ
ncbi:MAG TPA: ABC transporter permease [Candidatus Acidoferrales bacterium]